MKMFSVLATQKIHTAATSRNTFQIEDYFYKNIRKKIPEWENISYFLIVTTSLAFPNCQFFAQTHNHELTTSYCRW